MVGSNNELSVLEAVLESLVKSPAFALLEDAHTEPSPDALSDSSVPVASENEDEQFAALLNPTQHELSQMVPTPSEENEFSRMFGALSNL